MRLSAMILCAGIVAAACGPASDSAYPPAYELNFMRACEAQGPAAGVCPCTWERIEAEVPRADFEALERATPAERAADPLTARIEAYARACGAGQ